MSDFDNQSPDTEMNRIKTWIWAPIFWGAVVLLLNLGLGFLFDLSKLDFGSFATRDVLIAGSILIVAVGTLVPWGRTLAAKCAGHWLWLV